MAFEQTNSEWVNQSLLPILLSTAASEAASRGRGEKKQATITLISYPTESRKTEHAAQS